MTVGLCLLFAACGGDRDRDDRLDGDGGPLPRTDGGGTTSACEPSAGTALLEGALRLIDAEVGRLAEGEAERGVALVSSTEAGLMVVDREGTQVAVTDAETLSSALARRPDGMLCAIWARDGDEAVVVEHGCAPGFEVDASAEVERGEQFQLSEGGDGSTVVWFQGSFSSAAALVRDGSTLREVDLFESSISWFGDAASADGAPRACLINSSDSVALYGAGGFGGYDSLYLDPNVRNATGCRLATSGDATHMLAIARSSASLTSGPPDGGAPATLLPIDGVRGLAVVDDQPVVLHERSGGLRLMVPRDGELLDGPLEGAGPDDGGEPAFRAGRAEVVAADGGVDVFATGTAAGSSEPTLMRFTACRGDWPTTVFGADDPFERVELGTTSTVTAIGAAEDGTLFATTIYGGFGDGQLIRVRDGEATPVGSVNYAQDMHVSGPSDVWVAGGGTGSLSVHYYDGSEVETPWLTGGGRSALWIGVAGDGTLFILASGCLWRRSGDALEEVGCDTRGGFMAAWMRDADNGYGLGWDPQRFGTELPELPEGQWRSIAEASDATVWMAGAAGAVARLRGSDWENVETGLSADLKAIHPVSPTEIWVATSDDSLHRYDGASWTEVEPGTELSNVVDLAGTAASGLVVAARGGVVLRERR